MSWGQDILMSFGGFGISEGLGWSRQILIIHLIFYHIFGTKTQVDQETFSDVRHLVVCRLLLWSGFLCHFESRFQGFLLKCFQKFRRQRVCHFQQPHFQQACLLRKFQHLHLSFCYDPCERTCNQELCFLTQMENNRDCYNIRSVWRVWYMLDQDFYTLKFWDQICNIYW